MNGSANRATSGVGGERVSETSSIPVQANGLRRKLARATPADLDALLSSDPALRESIGFDMLRRSASLTGAVPWRTRGEPFWGNVDNAELQLYAETRHGLLAGIDAISVAVHAYAWRRSFHPVRDYLLPLRWDGVARAERWLVDHCGADDTPYVRAVSRCFLLAAVARVMSPGCKADAVLILEGRQGIGKSSAFRVLAGTEFFSDAPLNFSDPRQTGEALKGVWICELSELDGLNRAEVSAVKRCLSATADRYRAAYAREPETEPRQCVFCGSTNPDASGEYLRDRTGNRRFWPVAVTQCDLSALTRHRDQLWAEAVTLYAGNEHWWLESDDDIAAANEQAENRVEENPWLDRAARYVRANAHKSEIRTGEIFEIATGRACMAREQFELKLIADALRDLGFAVRRTNSGKVWSRA
ncbi:hypothetical protein BG58_04905 [Caballeronia jiangsuensis]|nr:hypothetical protein BG58_04905 [Caballeronia jiangsuensis]